MFTFEGIIGRFIRHSDNTVQLLKLLSLLKVSIQPKYTITFCLLYEHVELESSGGLMAH